MIANANSGASVAKEPSDNDLIGQLENGDQLAAAQLFKRYSPRVHRLAERQLSKPVRSRIDPDDIVQSVFHSFFRRVTGGGYAVPNGMAVWGLLVVIALNKCRSNGGFHRAHKRDVRRSVQLGGDSQASLHQSQENVALLQLSIDDYLSHQSPHRRAVIQMRVDGFSVAEIASNICCSKRSVERILQELRCELQQHNGLP